ncbi:hypothetical protein J6590_043621 [Homalodisca vitripennis]|nr:hypothetical protein J6590_043621 [Homalodisca vitripennis]
MRSVTVEASRSIWAVVRQPYRPGNYGSPDYGCDCDWHSYSSKLSLLSLKVTDGSCGHDEEIMLSCEEEDWHSGSGTGGVHTQ